MLKRRRNARCAAVATQF